MNKQSSLVKVLLLFLSLILLIGGGIFVYQEYNNVRAQQTILQTENGVLTNRISILEDARNYINSYVNVAVAAVPNTNAGFFALNSVRQQSDENLVGIDNLTIKTTEIVDTAKSQSELSFEVMGPVDNVMSFTNKLYKTLPLLGIVDLRAKVTGDTLLSLLTLRTYSKEYPVSLPSLSEPLSPLSEEERAVLEKLSTYKSPTISNQSETEEGDNTVYGKDNPFSEGQANVFQDNVEQEVEIVDQ